MAGDRIFVQNNTTRAFRPLGDGAFAPVRHHGTGFHRRYCGPALGVFPDAPRTWGEDLQKAAPDFYEKIVAVSPKAAELPTIGSIAKDGLPIETLVQYKPDVFVMTLDVYNAAKEKGYLEKLDGQQIKYVVTDFRRDAVDRKSVV